MKKLDQYNIAIRKFDSWYFHKIEMLWKVSIRDCAPCINSIDEFVNYLKGVEKHFKCYDFTLYPSRLRIFFSLRNSLDYGCEIETFKKKGRFDHDIEMRIFSRHSGKITLHIQQHLNFAYQYLNFLAELQEQFTLLENQLADAKMEAKLEHEKEEKILMLSKSSIKQWIDELFRGKYYEYWFQDMGNALLLSIRCRKDLQLDIPIAYGKFMETVPKILPTIRMYEEIIENSEVDVFISKYK